MVFLQLRSHFKGKKQEKVVLFSHKRNSVALAVVVPFQGFFVCVCVCFFFFASHEYEGIFHGTLHRINAAHQQMGAMCNRPVRDRHLFSLHTRGFQTRTSAE